MRRTLTNLRTDFRDATSDNDIADAVVDRLLNRAVSDIRARIKRYPSRETKNFYTTNGTAIYPMPIAANRAVTARVRIGSVDYPILPIDNPRRWERIKTDTSTSNQPQHFHATEKEIDFYPTPSDAQLITLVVETIAKPMSNADYTTGNVNLITNGERDVYGDGTVWTAAMVGRFFRIDSDDFWYKIAERKSNEHIVLEQDYEGLTVKQNDSDEAYTIGEQPDLPEDLHETVTHRAAMRYFQFIKRDRGKYEEHRLEFLEQINEAKERYLTRSSYRVSSPKRIRAGLINPNDWPTASE